MGVSRNDHVVYGYKLPYHNFKSNGEEVDLSLDKFQDLICGVESEKFSIYTDCYSDKYIVFGVTLATTPDNGDDNDFFKKIDLSLVNSEEIKEKYKQLFENEIKEEPYLFLFSYYS